MATILTQKQENFRNDLFNGTPQRDAYMNHYKTENMLSATIDRCACELAQNPKIATSLEEMRQAARSKLVINETRRKEILSEIAEGDITDYTTCGPDRDLISVGAESPNTKALQEVTSHTEYDKDGAGGTVVTKIKLKDSVKAIDLLNKMDGIYTDGGGKTININIDKVYVDARGKLEDALKRLAGRIGDAEG